MDDTHAARSASRPEPQATDLDHLDQADLDRARPYDLPPSPDEERRSLAEGSEARAADEAARELDGADVPAGADADHPEHSAIETEIAALVTSGPFRGAGHAEPEAPS